MKKLRQIVLMAVLLLSVIGISAQSNALERGIEHYRQGRTAQAITVLENLGKANDLKNEPRLWNYLGLAYLQSGDIKKGRQTLEKTVKLAPQNSDFLTNLAYAFILENKIDKAQAQIEKALKINPQNVAAYYLRGTARLREKKFDAALADAETIISIDAKYADAYTLKADALMASFGSRVNDENRPAENLDFLQKAAEALDFCLANCRPNESQTELSEKASAIKEFYKYFSREKTASLDRTAVTDPNSTPLKIISRPRANYTDEARRAGISGSVQIVALFSASGQISYALVLTPLGYGLAQQALQAARNIKFEPATRNGQPISVVRMIEYSFTIF